MQNTDSTALGFGLAASPTPPLTLPYPQLAELVLRYSVWTAGTAGEIICKATPHKTSDETQMALLSESVAYHISVVMSVLMQNHAIQKNSEHDQVEAMLFAALSGILQTPGNDWQTYLKVLDSRNTTKAFCYYSGYAKGLGLTEEQIQSYLAQCGHLHQSSEASGGGVGYQCYLMRLAQIIGGGAEVDGSVAEALHPVLVDGILNLQDDVTLCLA